MTSDVAVVHWDLPADGGGERVVWQLARTWDAPVYTATRNPEITPEDVTVESIFDNRRTLKSAIKSDLTGIRQAALVYGWLSTHQPLHDHDTLITSGNEPLFITPRDGQTWIHYAHHTGRLATDRLHKRTDWHTGLRGTLTKPLDYAWKYAQRQLSALEAQTPDQIITNSDIIKDRLHTYWSVPTSQITVIYPPVDTHTLAPTHAPTEDYYVAVGRVEPAKGIDLMIEAFRDLDERLVVAGSGSALDRLRERAPANVEFQGYVSEERKRELLAGARGFIMAAENEDFGISPIEALASGTPVIGVNEGFTKFQVHDGRNGVLVDRSPEGIQAGVHRLNTEGVAWTPEQIASDAERYSVDRFHTEMQDIVERVRGEKRDRRTPDWYPQPAPPREAEEEHGEAAVADGGDDT